MNKICRGCKELKSIEEFPHFSTKEAGRKNTCKECSYKLISIRNQLKKQNPPPVSGPCPICNQITNHWILDHCHFSNTFRGYICNSCNLGLGKFNDDMDMLRKAIDYLQNNGNNEDYQI
jgi:hypothetical protein